MSRSLVSAPGFIVSLFVFLLVVLHPLPLFSADNASRFDTEPQPDPPTETALGVSWIVTGDANRNATATLEYRQAGSKNWNQGFPLQRQEDSTITKPKHRHGNHYFYRTGVPTGKWRFAGSVWDLKPDTDYELRINYTDPDGGKSRKLLTARTRAIPPRKGPGRSLYTVPGPGGGTGTKNNPFKGLKTAFKAAQPGDNILLKPGTYNRLSITKNGTPGKSYHFIGLPGGDAVIKGGFNIRGRRYLSFDNLKIKHAGRAFSADGSVGITVRFCRIEKCKSGMHARNSQGFYIADNHLVGPSKWPRSKGIESTAGWDVGGQGHTICHNFISYVADGISCLRGSKNIAIDVYNNEIITCTDEGIELDYAHWNMRVYRNRLTDVYQGISYQPVQGGPTFTFRNIIYNCVRSTWKLHDYSSGQWIVNNTTIKKGSALVASMPRGYGVTNTHMYNNLFIGTSGHWGANFGIDLVRSTFDYNALVGDGFKKYIRWSRKGYASLDQLSGKGPVQANGHHFTSKDGPLFIKDLAPPKKTGSTFPYKEFDPRLKEGSAAIDKGKVIPAITTDHTGKAPDLGAFEFGDPLPHYGPRPYGAVSPPFISRFDAPATVKAGDPYPIRDISFWKAEQDSTVTATLHYRVKGGNTMKQAALQQSEDGRYSGEIPGTITRKTFEYYVEFHESGQKKVQRPEKPAAVIPDRKPPTRPADLKLTTNKSYTITFEWSPSTDDKGIAGYHIFKGTAQGFSPEQAAKLATTGSGASTFRDNAPEPGKKAVYAVQPFDVVGRTGPMAYIDVAVSRNLPPENSLALKTIPGSRAVNLSWTGDVEPDVTQIILFRSEPRQTQRKQIAKLDPSSTSSFLDKDLEPGKTYTYTLVLVDTGGLESNASKPVAGIPLGFVKRINCGGEKVTGPDGVDWEADRDRRYNTGIYTAKKARIKQANARMQNVYKTERWSYTSVGYEFDVTPGHYRVVLHFAETNPNFSKKGDRTFDIHIADEKVKEKFDIVAAAGSINKAVTCSFERRIKTGKLSITLKKNTAGPCIKGIEIMEIQATAVKSADDDPALEKK